MFEVLCKARSKSLVVSSLCHPFLPFGLICFLLCNAHQVGPLPSLGPWVVTLHLWSTSRPHGDSLSLLCSWWGEDGIPWCCARCVYIHHKKHWFSRCVRANPQFFHLPPSSPLANKLTLCFQLMAFACWLMSSLFIPFGLIWFHALHCFEG